MKTSRRDFLKTGAVFSGGLLISFAVPAAARRMLTGNTTFAPNAFLRIGTDNKISIILAHVEMGQGIWTTLPMLLADELDADLHSISIEHSPAGKPYMHTAMPMQITGGSTTTWSEFDRYRQAGATARVLLVQAAAAKFSVRPEDCKTEKGFVIAGDQRASYGELATAAAALPVPEKVTLRTPEDWKLIGKGAKRLDAPGKVTGQAIYGMDIQQPGQLTALVAHAPVYGGSVKSFDSSEALKIPGVRKVLQIPTGIAVLADNFWAAKKGRNALQVTWDDGPNVNIDSTAQLKEFKALALKPGLPATKGGNVDAGLTKSAKVIEAEYTFPYLAHAPMEPMNCTVKIQGNICDIWTGTQLPMMDQAAAAKILGLQPEQVNIHIPFLGGGFGRRACPHSDFVTEAVHIAKASGEVVKLVWTREDDMKAGYYRPSVVHKVKAGVDHNGMPVAWYHNIVGQSIMSSAGFDGWIKNGIDDSSTEGVADSPYLVNIPDKFVGLHSPKLGLPVLWFRSVGNTHTAAVMETMIDELAHNAGKDPVEYRRTLLKDHPRHLAALNLATEKAAWGKPLPAGRYQGVAVHEAFKSYVCQVAEISVSPNGTIRVHKVVCAIDCGLAVNPDGVAAQMESGINYGIAAALYGKITLSRGRVDQSNFHDYQVARMNDTPPLIEVYIVDSKEEMGGAGEPGTPPIAPAIANAVFRATGQRLRNLPFGNINLSQLNRHGKEV